MERDEDMWAPRRVTPNVVLNPEDTYAQPKYPCMRPSESFTVTIPCIRLIFEIEHTIRVPVLMCKVIIVYK